MKLLPALSSVIVLVSLPLSARAQPLEALSVPEVVAQPSPISPMPAEATLASLVAELERNNPELEAARRDVDMRLARVAPAGALPDPTLSAGSMAGFSRPPFFPSSATPDGSRQVGITQEFPFPGKRALRTQVASAEVEAQRWEYETRRVFLVAQLKDEQA